MTSFRIAFSELRRLTAGRLPRIAVLALVLVPTLYAGFYLYANHDPYGGLNRVPAALVVADEGASLDGERVNYGRQIGEQLLDSGDFEWHEVDRAQARAGVEDGTYDFALTVPAGFSGAITSPARFDAEQARLVMTTNDANSYLASTIADTVTTKVRDAISSEVTERAATTLLQSMGGIRAELVDAADGAQRLADGLDGARTGGRQLADGLGTLKRGTTTLPASTRRLADGAARVAAGDERVATAGREAARVADDATRLYRRGRVDLRAVMRRQDLDAAQQRELLGIYDSLNRPLTQAARRVRQASGRLDRLAEGADQVATGADDLADASPALASGIRRADAGARRLSRGLGRADKGARLLATGLDRGVEELPDLSDRTITNVARTLADPVGVESRAQTHADSYGAGLAPFFLSLGAWIGGYVLFLLVRPLSTRAIAANQSPLRVALGGWLTPALLGLAQMAVVLTVVTLGVGISAGHVLPTLAFLALVSVTFIAIVHALNAWLGPAGQFIGLALMVVQLVTAGGTFPWQTIPEPLHPVHHALPMSYAVDGLRQLMYGGLSGLAWHDVVVLLGWLVGALTLTALAAHRHRRWTPSRMKPELTL